MSALPYFKTVIIGAGPAGTGPIMYAIKKGVIHDLLEQGILIIEKGKHLVRGNMPDYKINSDTLSDVFLESLDENSARFFDLTELKEDISNIQDFKGRNIPLGKTDSFFRGIGNQLERIINGNANSKVLIDTCVEDVILQSDGNFRINCGGSTSYVCTNLIVATGGKQTTKYLIQQIFEENISLAPFADKTLFSESILKSEADKKISTAICNSDTITILGGSHSAFSCAWYILKILDSFPDSKSEIIICMNQLPKLFFGSTEEAFAAGYSDFSTDDICPVTKRIYRLAGLRMDGRELYMKIAGHLSPKENRVKILLREKDNTKTIAVIQDSSLLINALGYNFSSIPFFDKNENRIILQGEKSGRWTNNNCQLLRSDRTAIKNGFAIGLGTGFIPSGEMGGEASFTGFTNGIWYYQNELGKLILDQIMK